MKREGREAVWEGVILCQSVEEGKREAVSGNCLQSGLGSPSVCVWNQSCEMRLESRNQMEMESN